VSLSVDIRHRQGGFQLDALFEAEPGVTALFGRSGAGKTTLVYVIAGLIRPDEGRVTVDGEALVDTRRGVFVPRHKRHVGYVFQEGRLFPHLTVRQNLLYGRWFAGRGEGGGDPAEVIRLLDIAPLLGRRPAALSGGEKQRVAIGRALLAHPRLLLMDEPLASLDEARKAEILPYIERLRDAVRIPIVYVSHSLAEVTRLSTTVAVLSEGRVAAAGPTDAVLSRLDLFPLAGREEFGAVIEAEVTSHDDAHALTALACPAGRLFVPRLELAPGRKLRLRIRARDVILAVKPPEGLSALNVLQGRVAEIGPAQDGPAIDVALDCGGQRLLARVTRKSAEVLALTPGKPIYAVVKSVAFGRRGLLHPGAVDSDAG
jgi:molybdate transport system ATP-binding protein